MRVAKHKKQLLFGGLLLGCLLLGGGYLIYREAGGASAPREPYRVAMIVKSTNSAFWKSVFAGAAVAATEYNVELTTEGPETEDDYETQNRLVKTAVEEGADAIIFSAVDYNANAEVITEAAEEGVSINQLILSRI